MDFMELARWLQWPGEGGRLGKGRGESSVGQWLSPDAQFATKRHSSVYFSARPRAFSTGYFRALAAIFASMAAATSMPVTLANSNA
jgi:hypothetical protein